MEDVIGLEMRILRESAARSHTLVDFVQSMMGRMQNLDEERTAFLKYIGSMVKNFTPNAWRDFRHTVSRESERCATISRDEQAGRSPPPPPPPSPPHPRFLTKSPECMF